MVSQVDAFRMGQKTLRQLVDDLRGLYVAADAHDQTVQDEFEDHWSTLDVELALRSEPWAPAGAANDQTLTEALVDFESWIQGLLASSSFDQHD